MTFMLGRPGQGANWLATAGEHTPTKFKKSAQFATLLRFLFGAKTTLAKTCHIDRVSLSLLLLATFLLTTGKEFGMFPSPRPSGSQPQQAQSTQSKLQDSASLSGDQAMKCVKGELDIYSLTKIFDEATKKALVRYDAHGNPLSPEPLPKHITLEMMSRNCSQYFREVMTYVGSHTLQVGQKTVDLRLVVESELTDPNCNANCLIGRISKSRNWVKLDNASDDELQILANRGVLIEATYLNPNPNESGHLASVYPTPPPPPGLDLSEYLSRFCGSGPFVRDGNARLYDQQGAVDANCTAGKIYASTWGAVKASVPTLFHAHRNDIKWYAWVPSISWDRDSPQCRPARPAPPTNLRVAFANVNLGPRTPAPEDWWIWRLCNVCRFTALSSSLGCTVVV